jgi:hypothetical protein
MVSSITGYELSNGRVLVNVDQFYKTSFPQSNVVLQLLFLKVKEHLHILETSSMPVVSYDLEIEITSS